eukprot:TRINITY_DN7726_c0_g3_i1.p1 TRINITY_DN7726_c0_g3~~TRINITY_DN7726_c0_g3_i1.p1  ORF type:complete len:328 (-),score=59.63 TRINITY_DN7726_c0_g3_i1:2474-3457(-)
MSRIDMFLLSKEWDDHFVGVIQVALPRSISDHCPIKLCSNSIDWGPSISGSRIAGYIIKIFWDWLDLGGDKLASKVLQVTSFTRNFVLLKDYIKMWNKDVFGCIDESREAFSKVVVDIDKKGECQELTQEESTTRQQAVGRIWDVNRMEEISWRQKSRVTWLKEGDKNTKFFHRMATVRSIVNFMGRIRRGGRILESPIEVNNEIACFFEELYKCERLKRAKLDELSFPKIPDEVQSWLEREFEDEEVSRALEECDGDKAPGPDGFNFSFIKVGWDFLKEDFSDMLSKFHRRGRINRQLNATFITLIPKIPNPVNLCDYRPIGLMGC